MRVSLEYIVTKKILEKKEETSDDFGPWLKLID